MEKLFRLATHNCWGQADALFAVCMSEAQEAEAVGFLAAKKVLTQPCYAIQFRLQCNDSPLPSVHAFVAIRHTDSDVVSICQAYQSLELPMHVTKTMTKDEFADLLCKFFAACGRKKKLEWKSVHTDVEDLCGLDLGDCFQFDSQIRIQVYSVSWN